MWMPVAADRPWPRRYQAHAGIDSSAIEFVAPSVPNDRTAPIELRLTQPLQGDETGSFSVRVVALGAARGERPLADAILPIMNAPISSNERVSFLQSV